MSVNAEEKAELRVNAEQAERQEEQLHRQGLEVVNAEQGAPCADCAVNTVDQWYMVKDAVWAHALGPADGFLCLACLGIRLGRTLWSADFTHSPVNAWLLEAR